MIWFCLVLGAAWVIYATQRRVPLPHAQDVLDRVRYWHGNILATTALRDAGFAILMYSMARLLNHERATRVQERTRAIDTEAPMRNTALPSSELLLEVLSDISTFAAVFAIILATLRCTGWVIAHVLYHSLRER